MAEGPHFFLDSLPSHDTARITGGDARHLATVLRARNGDPVSVSDGQGTVWQGHVAQVAGDTVEVRVGEPLRVERREPRIIVVQALPKQRKLDQVVEGLTEVGVDEIRPATSLRSEVALTPERAAKAVARWRAVAHAAAKQSRRAWKPSVRDVSGWDDAFEDASTGVACWEESRVALHDVLSGWDKSPTVTIAIGPEGGLEATEVEATGLPHATLGDTILRTETAALVATSAVRYHLGLMTRGLMC